MSVAVSLLEYQTFLCHLQPGVGQGDSGYAPPASANEFDSADACHKQRFELVPIGGNEARKRQ
jgi:hypothetical protein